MRYGRSKASLAAVTPEHATGSPSLNTARMSLSPSRAGDRTFDCIISPQGVGAPKYLWTGADEYTDV